MRKCLRAAEYIDLGEYMNTERFDEFIVNYPIFEYRVIDPKEIGIYDRVRTICRTECTRYGSTWACPPGVGSLTECSAKLKDYDTAIVFSSVAEVSDILNFEENLSTRQTHEELTEAVGDFWRGEGYDVYILSTESCDICEHCTYPEGKPCRFPDRMHPCIESYGVLVSEIAEKEGMEYDLGGNTILWFSLILLRK